VGIEHVVLLSSTAVHHPSHQQPGDVSETPLPPVRRESAPALAWRRLEERAAALFAAPEAPLLTVLRPAPLAWGGPWGERWLGGRWCAVVPGFDPVLQCLDPDDLARAILRVVEEGLEGTYHVAPEEPVPLRRGLRLAGVRAVPVPATVQRLLGGRAHRAEVERRRHPATVSSDALGETGWRAHHSSSEALWRFAGSPPARAAEAARADDLHGQDIPYIDRLGRARFRFLHDIYWRVEERGLEHVPATGGAVLVGVHRGFMPLDGVMALHAIARTRGRYPRFLIHPTLVKFPFIASFMRRLGGVIACRRNGDRVLEEGQILGVFPEGIRGAFRLYREARTLARFGRPDYVRFALRHGVPIVPFVTVGSAEILPILAKIRWRLFERLSEWPCLPITPTAFVPLPSKWHTLYLPPIPVAERYGPGAEEDPKIVREVDREVRVLLQHHLDDLWARRPGIFWGSIFEPGSETD
jgi:1-acyl-sn-glycerol-3-phosphate acyltransferase